MQVARLPYPEEVGAGGGDEQLLTQPWDLVKGLIRGLVPFLPVSQKPTGDVGGWARDKEIPMSSQPRQYSARLPLYTQRKNGNVFKKANVKRSRGLSPLYFVGNFSGFASFLSLSSLLFLLVFLLHVRPFQPHTLGPKSSPQDSQDGYKPALKRRVLFRNLSCYHRSDVLKSIKGGRRKGREKNIPMQKQCRSTFPAGITALRQGVGRQIKTLQASSDLQP